MIIMKKPYIFRGIGVPTLYLLLAMSLYIAFAIFCLFLLAQTLRSIRTEEVENPGFYVLGFIGCLTLIFLITRKFFDAFKAQKGIPKPYSEARNIESAMVFEQLSIRSQTTKGNPATYPTTGVYFIPTDDFLWPWQWIFNGDTAGTHSGKTMRRMIPVWIDTDDERFTPSNINGQNILLAGAKSIILVKEEEIPYHNTGITFFPRRNWL